MKRKIGDYMWEYEPNMTVETFQEKNMGNIYMEFASDYSDPDNADMYLEKISKDVDNYCVEKIKELHSDWIQENM